MNMKKLSHTAFRVITVMLSLQLLLIPMTLPAAAGGEPVEFVFDSKKSIVTFMSHSTMKISFDAETSYLKIDFDNNQDPLFVANMKAGTVDLDQYKFIKIKLYAGCAGNSMQMFFSTHESEELTEAKTATASYKSMVWNEVIIDMSRAAEWKGDLLTLRVDPVSASSAGEKMYIEYISFFASREEAEAYRPLTDAQKAENEEYYKKVAEGAKDSPYYSQGGMVYKFNSYENIVRLTSAYANRGMVTSLVDRSMLCKVYGYNANIPLRMDSDMQFNASDYKYMKIKYFSNCRDDKFTFLFVTGSGDENSYSLKRRDGSWQEAVVDLNGTAGWEGLLTAFRIRVAETHFAAQDDYCFIEYIAFFEEKETADAYGGITGKQTLGKDDVTAYYNGDKVSFRYKDLPVFGQETGELKVTAVRHEAAPALSEPADTGTPAEKERNLGRYGVLCGAAVPVSGAAVLLRKRGKRKEERS